MKDRWIKPIVITTIACLLLVILVLMPRASVVIGQFPTVDMPTVTSSPRGPYIIVKLLTTVYDPLNVRAGPNALTEQIGVLLVGQEANAIGQYGDWIQIEYPGAPNGIGWVFAPYVDLVGGSVPFVEPPPTSTPQTTKTIDPTLAAQFIITAQPTRLSTFTEPPPLAIPTFEVENVATAPGGIPMGFVIIGLAGLGIFMGLVALLRRG